MTVIGIDPGLSGGIAAAGASDFARPMPVLNKQPDLGELGAIYAEFRPGVVVIERVQIARRADGKGPGANSLQIGINYGLILGQLRALGIPVIEVQPVTWKAHFKLRNQGGESPKQLKEKSIALARSLFPHVVLKATPRCTIYHDGMAEALLLAEYGRRTAKPAAPIEEEGS